MVVCPCVVMIPASSQMKETKIPKPKTNQSSSWQDFQPKTKNQSKTDIIIKTEPEKQPYSIYEAEKPLNRIDTEKTSQFNSKPNRHQPVKAHQYPQQPVKAHQYPQQPVKMHLDPQQPVKTQQFIQQPVRTHQFPQQPVKTQQYIQQPVRTHQYTTKTDQPFKNAQRKQGAGKSESLVLSNVNGKYVGTKPLKSKQDESLKINESKSYIKRPTTSSNFNKLKICSSTKQGTQPTSKPFYAMTEDLPLVPIPPFKREQSNRSYSVAEREPPLKPHTTFSKDTPSFQEKRLQFRQKVMQDNMQVVPEFNKVNATGNDWHTSTLPRLHSSRLSQDTKRSSCGIHIENYFDTQSQKDLQNLKKTYRNSMIDSSVATDSRCSIDTNRIFKLIALESSQTDEPKQAIPEIHDFVSTQKSTKKMATGFPSVTKLSEKSRETKKESKIPSHSKRESLISLINSPITHNREDLVNLEFGPREGSGESMALSDALSVFALEDDFDVDNVEDDQKDLSQALSDIPEELLAKSDVSINNAMADNSSSEELYPDYNMPWQNDSSEAINEFSSKLLDGDINTSISEIDPSVDELLRESFQNLQKEVQSLNVQSLDFQEKRKLTSKLTQTYDDDDDYIDVDCEVPPMATLQRPLGYDYRNIMPSRAINVPGFARYSWNIDEFNHFNPVYNTNYPTSEDTEAQSTFRETYWDYWLAKNKLQHLKSSRDLEVPEPLSITIGKRCCSSEKVHYDPEILLAQVVHPKSLEHATFSEYSSQVKSSILERLSIQKYEASRLQDHHYGSCLNISQNRKHTTTNGQTDPGYYSESDASNRKADKTKNNGCQYSGNNVPLRSPSQDARINSHVNSRTTNLHSNYLQPRYYEMLEDQSIEGTERVNDYEVESEFPYSYHHYNQNRNSRGFIGENPWMHLLTDVTPPRTPMRDSDQVKLDKQCLTSSPSITSLPAFGQRLHNPSLCNFNQLPSASRSSLAQTPQNRERRTLQGGSPFITTRLSQELTPSAGELKATAKCNVHSDPTKKTRKKSFLPTFLWKKKPLVQPTNTIGEEREEEVVCPQPPIRVTEKYISTIDKQLFCPPNKLDSNAGTSDGRSGMHQKGKKLQSACKPLQITMLPNTSELASISSSSSSSSTKSSQDSVRTVISRVVS